MYSRNNRINSKILNKTYHKTEQIAHSNTHIDRSRKPVGAGLQNGVTKNVTLSNNQNGIRNALIKGTIKRGNFSKLKGEINSMRKKDKDEPNQLRLTTSRPNPLLLTRK